jgi:hypothetical protein
MPVRRAAPDRICARRKCCRGQNLLIPRPGVHYAEAGDQLAALAELVPAPVTCPGRRNPGEPSAVARRLTRSRSKMFWSCGQGRRGAGDGASSPARRSDQRVPPGKTIIIPPTRRALQQEYRVDHSVVGDAARARPRSSPKCRGRRARVAAMLASALGGRGGERRNCLMGETSRSDEVPLNRTA